MSQNKQDTLQSLPSGGEEKRISLIVIDEHPETLDEFVKLAAVHNIDIKTADDTEEIRLGGNKPDAVVLGWDYPSRSTAPLNFVSRLLSGTPPYPQIYIYSQSSYMIDRIEASRLGASGFINRSQTPGQVLGIILNAMEQKRLNTQGRILCLGTQDQQSNICKALQTMECQFEFINKPLIFWKTLEEYNPDAVVVDYDEISQALSLSERQGSGALAICEIMRRDPRWELTPVIYYTSSFSSEILTSLNKAGADFLLDASYPPETFAACLKNFLKKNHTVSYIYSVDQLTRLLNRRSALQEFSRLAGLARRQRQPLSMIIVDLDHFKSINDLYGHAVGDLVLANLSSLLKESFLGSITSRWGGDELVFFVPGLDRINAADYLTQVLERFRKMSFSSDQGSFSCTFSGGVSEFPADGPNIGKLYKAADRALYNAKRSGKNKVYTSQPAEEQNISTDLLLCSHRRNFSAVVKKMMQTRSRSLAAYKTLEDMCTDIAKGRRFKAIVIDSETVTNHGLNMLTGLSAKGDAEPESIIVAVPSNKESDYRFCALSVRQFVKCCETDVLMGMLVSIWSRRD